MFLILKTSLTEKVTDEDVAAPIVLVVEWRDLEGNDGELEFVDCSIKRFWI